MIQSTKTGIPATINKITSKGKKSITKLSETIEQIEVAQSFWELIKKNYKANKIKSNI